MEKTKSRVHSARRALVIGLIVLCISGITAICFNLQGLNLKSGEAKQIIADFERDTGIELTTSVKSQIITDYSYDKNSIYECYGFIGKGKPIKIIVWLKDSHLYGRVA